VFFSQMDEVDLVRRNVVFDVEYIPPSRSAVNPIVTGWNRHGGRHSSARRPSRCRPFTGRRSRPNGNPAPGRVVAVRLFSRFDLAPAARDDAR